MKDRIFKAFDGINLSETKRKIVLNNVLEGSMVESNKKNFWQGKAGGALVIAAVALVFVVVNVMLIGGNRNGRKTPLGNLEPDLQAALASTEASISESVSLMSTMEPDTMEVQSEETIIEPTTVEIYNAETTGVCSYPTQEVEIVVSEKEPVEEVELSFRVPVNNYIITADFGARYGVMHYGTDMSFTDDKNIYAAEAGKVVRAEYDVEEGNIVMIDHGNGIVSEYSCLESIEVDFGSMVNAGDVIGVMGTTGYSTGVHLCWKMQVNGEYVDPMSMIK